jgi:hypothetical protein
MECKAKACFGMEPFVLNSPTYGNVTYVPGNEEDFPFDGSEDLRCKFLIEDPEDPDYDPENTCAIRLKALFVDRYDLENTIEDFDMASIHNMQDSHAKLLLQHAELEEQIAEHGGQLF